MDALFGLPRKKSAGQSFSNPLSGKLFFLDQDLVDDFVAAESMQKRADPKVYSYIHVRGPYSNEN